jgi:ACR3 family arsenite transporter
MSGIGARLGFLDRFLTLWIFLAMALGVALGVTFDGLPKALDSHVGRHDQHPDRHRPDPDDVSAARPRALRGAAARVRRQARAALSLIQNWIIGPVLMFALAVIFLRDKPEYMTGLILIGLARCIAMVIVWNQLAKGDNQYVAALVAFNSIFQILFFSIYAWFFLAFLPPLFGLAGQRDRCQLLDDCEAVLIYLGIPFLAGFLTRRWLIGPRGALVRRALPAQDRPITLVALLFTIVAMFSLKGGDRDGCRATLRIAMPLVIYFRDPVRHQLLMGRLIESDYPRTTAPSPSRRRATISSWRSRSPSRPSGSPRRSPSRRSSGRWSKCRCARPARACRALGADPRGATLGPRRARGGDGGVPCAAAVGPSSSSSARTTRGAASSRRSGRWSRRGVMACAPCSPRRAERRSRPASRARSPHSSAPDSSWRGRARRPVPCMRSRCPAARPARDAGRKRFDDPRNPSQGFLAVMVCSAADAACPTVRGAGRRLTLTYEDPKAADGTPGEAAAYDRCCAEIARELLWAVRCAARAAPFTAR